MANFQFVTLVAAGGSPVRIADQTGASLATTGNGSLVFSNGATLTNVTITGLVEPSPLGLTAGTVANPSLYFVTNDRGIFSRAPGEVSFAANGALMAAIQNDASSFFFSLNGLQAKFFSDTAGEVILQGYDTAGSAMKQLSLQKYGSNVAVGPAVALPVGGSATTSGLQFTSSNVSFSAGTGAPTLSAPLGSLYMRADSTSLPYYNTNGTTTWDQLVGRTATQTLTNKTLTSPTITGATVTSSSFASPTITGTVAGAASYTGVTLTGPTITGGITAAGTVGIAGSVRVTDNTTTALVVVPNGTSNPVLTVDASTGSAVAGLALVGAVTGGTVALVTTDSGAATNLTINAKGTGTIGIGSVSTGRVTITPVTTITGALTLSATLLGAAATFSGNVNTTAGAVNYLGVTTGAADAMAITATPAITAYTVGCVYVVKANAGNATTTPTIDINSLGAKTIVKRVSTALAAGDYGTNMFAQLLYDGTNMVLLNPVVN